MGSSRALIYGIAIVAVVIAFVVIVALVISSNSSASQSSADLPTATSTEDEGSIRTKVYAEMTATQSILDAIRLQESVYSLQTAVAGSAMTPTAQPPVDTPTTMPQPTVDAPTSAPQPAVTVIVFVTTQPEQQVAAAPTQPPTPVRQPERQVWDDHSFNVQTGSVTLGNSEAWVVFQGWDGRSNDTTIHGVIEPGRRVIIPAPFQGTYWTVTGITYEAITERALEMRDEALDQGTAGTAPSLVYIGEEHVPEGYSIQIPRSWQIE